MKLYFCSNVQWCVQDNHVTEILVRNKTEAVCSGVYKFVISLKDKLSSKTEAVSAGQSGLSCSTVCAQSLHIRV